MGANKNVMGGGIFDNKLLFKNNGLLSSLLFSGHFRFCLHKSEYASYSH